MTPQRIAWIGAGIHMALLVAVFFLWGDTTLDAHDGHAYASLAFDPLLLDNPDLDFPAYRAIRVGLPLLAVPFMWAGPFAALAIVEVAGVWIGVWAMARLALRRGLSPWLGLAFAVLPGTLVASRVLVADALAAAALLAAFDAYEAGMVIWPWATLAVLTKETMIVGVVVLAVMGWRKAWIPISIFGVWAGSLILRFGWDSPEHAAGWPFTGLAEAFTVWWASQAWDEIAAGVLLLGVVVVAVYLAVRWRTPLLVAAGLMAATVPVLGFAVVNRAIHSQRVILFPLAVLVIAIPSLRREIGLVDSEVPERSNVLVARSLR